MTMGWWRDLTITITITYPGSGLISTKQEKVYEKLIIAQPRNGTNKLTIDMYIIYIFINYILKLQLLNLFHHAFWRWFYEWRPYILPQILKDWNLFKRIKVKWNRALLSPGGLITRHGILIKSSASVDIRGKSFRKNIVIFSESVSLTKYVVLSVCPSLDIVARRRSDYCPRGAIFYI